MNGLSHFTGGRRLGQGASFSALSPIYPQYLQRWNFSVTPFECTNIREQITAFRWRVRFKIAGRAIVTATAIGLTAVSLVLAAPPSGTDPHGTDKHVDHTATSASHGARSGRGILRGPRCDWLEIRSGEPILKSPGDLL
jgi:hypothetical protein